MLVLAIPGLTEKVNSLSYLALDHYLKDIAEDSPCGVNLENDPAFAELEQEIKGTPERQIGDSIIPAKEPDWIKIRTLALALLDRSRDIQVTIHLTCALVRTDGFAGLDDGLTLIREFLQKHWDDVYPRQEPEDDYPVLRINTLFTLKDYQKILDPIANIPLTNSKLGRYSWNQIETAKKNVDTFSHMTLETYDEYLKRNADINASYSMEEAKKNASDEVKSIEAAFKETNLESLQSLAKVIKHALEQAEGIETVISEKVGSENSPNISVLATLLKNIQKILNDNILQKQAAELEKNASEMGAQNDQVSAGLIKGGEETVKLSVIQSREDVITAIDAICRYFERYEPSSPVPFLLQRAKKLLSMNFMEILRDLTPDAVSQAENICGVQKTE